MIRIRHCDCRLGAAPYLLSLLLLAACTGSNQALQEGLPAVQSRYSGPTELSQSASDIQAAEPPTSSGASILHLGRRAFIGQSALPTDIAGANAGGFTLNFVNADVNDVVKVVLGDELHLNYAVDQAVQGNLTLRSETPLVGVALLAALEESLRAAGFALTIRAGIYRVVRAADAAREADGRLTSGGSASTPGYSTTMIALRYVSAADMLRLLGPLLSDASQIKADDARNLLFVTGSSQERAAVADDVALLDVDYLAGMSFAIVPLLEASAGNVVNELQSIIAPKGGPLAGLVRFVGLERMRSVLVLSSQPRYVSAAREWISRLDHVQTGDATQVFVYEVQNGRASDLSASLRKLIEEQGTGSSTMSAGGGSATLAGTNSNGPPADDLELPAASALNGDLPTPGQSTGAPTSGPKITADEISNAVLFYGTPAQYRGILQSLRQLDVPPLQVLLEAVIAEVTLTKSLDYGVQFSFEDSHNTLLNSIGGLPIAATLPGAVYAFGTQNIKVILDALSGITNVDVISAPKVLVLNNQTAKLDVGSDVPVTTQIVQSTVTSGAPTVNSIQYRETGVLLKVTPRVNESGQVQLDISQEVSDVAPTTSSTLNSPTFDERRISSTVSIQDGETIALGGLIKDSRSTTAGGIPYLQEIPLLGALFSHKANNATRTELLVLVTPHVVQSVERLRNVTAELRHHMGEVEALLEH